MANVSAGWRRARTGRRSVRSVNRCSGIQIRKTESLPPSAICDMESQDAVRVWRSASFRPGPRSLIIGCLDPASMTRTICAPDGGATSGERNFVCVVNWDHRTARIDPTHWGTDLAHRVTVRESGAGRPCCLRWIVPSRRHTITAMKSGSPLRTELAVAAVIVGLVLVAGFVHLVHGGGAGLKLCAKNGWTLGDIFIDRDDYGERLVSKGGNAQVLEAMYECGALRRPVHEDAEASREVSSQRAPSPTEQTRAARPALPQAQPVESAPAQPRFVGIGAA